MNGMWKYALAAVGGFLITVLTLAVGREVYFAFQARPAADIIGSSLSAIGSLGWVDTTLVTGLAAVAAAYLSVSAVRQQIDQTAEIERARIAARRAGVKANLGIALSAICDYATECAQLNHFLLSKCGDSRLPREIDIPAFPTIPDGAVATITAMVEFAEPKNREAIARIGPSIQVCSARIRGMKRDRVDLGSSPRRENLLDYIVDALEIYARCSEVFDYARDKPGATARRLEKGDIVSAVHNASLFSIYDDEIKRWAKAREEYLAANNGL